MHEVQALIAKSDSLAAHAGKFESAIVCPLVQGFSLLPLTDGFVKELTGHQWPTHPPFAQLTPELPDGVYSIACEISHDCPVAYINTYYFGGHGGQDALVWENGSLRFSPATQGYNQVWPNSPISQALRAIGAIADKGKDEFDTLGLGTHRETHRWAQSAK